ncbi:MAG: proton-conducting transporter membrane subunit [Thermoplasmatota archaeon]
MVALIVALPLFFAFLFLLTKYFGIHRTYLKGIFLLGILSPLPVFLLNMSDLPAMTVLGGWTRVAGLEIGIDGLNFFFLLASFIVFPMVAVYSLKHFDKNEEVGVSSSSKYFLILLLYGGILGSLVSRDLFNYAVYLEITSITAIILVSSSNARGAKFASFRYLMLYLISSVFFIFAIGIIYVKTGYLNLYLIQQNLIMDKEMMIAITLAFVALITKAGIFPLHFWLPEAHSKADTPVSALLSGLTVKVPVFGMLLFLRYTSIDFLIVPLFIVSLCSIYFGIFMAIFQDDVKKFLAYSTVSQMGFILVGISTLNIHATGLYVFTHSMAKAGLFMGIGILISSHGNKSISELTFSGRKFLMVTIVLLALGIGGVSPFLGGYAKYSILKNLSKYSIYLFYIGSIGTLTLFTRLIFELTEFDLREKIRFEFKELVPFILALVSLGVGIYYYPEFSFTDIILIGLAVIAFIVLKYTKVLKWKIPHYYEYNEEGLAGQINFYTTVFVVVNILFILYVLNFYGGLHIF